MNIGEKLFELRKEKNLSQEEVAEKLNVTRQSVSKWETGQSTPDFDKILPLCELYEITTEELLTGKKPEVVNVEDNGANNIEENSEENIRNKTADVVSSSVFIYIVSVAAFLVLVAVPRVNPVISLALFLTGIAYATSKLVKHYMSLPKKEKTEKEKKEDKVLKSIKEIVEAICISLYFIISFTTGAWHITWIIFIIDGLIEEIFKLIFMLKGKEVDSDEE